MRIIETVFPLNVPQQPRVFTLEVTEDELEEIRESLQASLLDGFEAVGEMYEQIEDALN